MKIRVIPYLYPYGYTATLARDDVGFLAGYYRAICVGGGLETDRHVEGRAEQSVGLVCMHRTDQYGGDSADHLPVDSYQGERTAKCNSVNENKKVFGRTC